MRTITTHIDVEFGDCDPALIVYFPNFFRWVDASGRRFFAACGIPPWHETEQTHGIIGTPCVTIESRFVAPASYGDSIDIYTSVVEWRTKSFVFEHLIRRAETLLVEVHEVRVFAQRVDGDRHRIRAVPMPPEWRALCD